MKPYSLDICQNIVNTYEAGNTSVRKVAERFQLSKSTVQEILKRKRETGKLLPRQTKRGKPSPLLGQEEQIKEMVVEHPDYTAEYCEYWQDKTGVRLSESAMCRFLQKQKLTVKKNYAGAKPINKVQKNSR
jgi:putative transposase